MILNHLLLGLASLVPASASAPSTTPNATTASLPRLEPIKHVKTDVLQIAYYEEGPKDGEVVILLHGWPYDINSFIDVAPALAARGYRVIVPYLRGNGPTLFLNKHTFRSGDQAAFGADVIALLDALHIPKAIFAGFDWGSRAACVAAALWPERCAGIVSVNSYAINDIAALGDLDVPRIEAGFWYFYYFLTSQGRRVLSNDAKEIARVVWTKNSPAWNFTEADLDRTTDTYENWAYVDIVLHVYRHGLGYAAGDPAYADIQERLLTNPVITVPAVTLDGLNDGNFPATDGSDTAKYFTGPRIHHKVPNAGHNLPQENPKAFVDAVIEVSKLKK
ncbi:Alpha/Beta hydrolase protein [Trichoderma barbatum]